MLRITDLTIIRLMGDFSGPKLENFAKIFASPAKSTPTAFKLFHAIMSQN